MKATGKIQNSSILATRCAFVIGFVSACIELHHPHPTVVGPLRYYVAVLGNATGHLAARTIYAYPFLFIFLAFRNDIFLPFLNIYYV
jgi:hypothetical protein